MTTFYAHTDTMIAESGETPDAALAATAVALGIGDDERAACGFEASEATPRFARFVKSRGGTGFPWTHDASDRVDLADDRDRRGAALLAFEDDLRAMDDEALIEMSNDGHPISHTYLAEVDEDGAKLNVLYSVELGQGHGTWSNVERTWADDATADTIRAAVLASARDRADDAWEVDIDTTLRERGHDI